MGSILVCGTGMVGYPPAPPGPDRQKLLQLLC